MASTRKKTSQRKARGSTANRTYSTRATTARHASSSKKHPRIRSPSPLHTDEPPRKQQRTSHSSADASNMEDDGADDSASVTSYTSEKDAQDSDDSLVEATPSQKGSEQVRSKVAQKLAFETLRFITSPATQSLTVISPMPTTAATPTMRPVLTSAPVINTPLSGKVQRALKIGFLQHLGQTEPQTQVPHEQSGPDQVNSSSNDNINFVPARSGRGHANLHDQPTRLRTVLANSLPAVFRTFCLHQSYENVKVYTKWVRAILIKTAIAEKYEDVHKRLSEDDQYAKDAAQIILNRVQGWRSQVFKVAIAEVESTYQLSGLSAVDRANEIKLLLTWDRSYRYTFPFDPRTRTPAKDKPYMLPIFCNALAPLFRMACAKSAYKCFKALDGSLELPITLLAMSATMVYAALDYLQTGTEHSRHHPLDTGRYFAVYTGNLNQLRDIQKKPATEADCHLLLHYLLECVCPDLHSDGEAPSTPDAVETDIDVINIDEL
ncbi:hypothetical protein BDW22DRAFT_1456985 [Trametopsis cervina]|nr:hypothetical protein BDW22DRAFT_1456985 [Trametopsis cervina]